MSALRPGLPLLLVAINLVGGLAVLGSYALALRFPERVQSGLWGDLPAGFKPLYVTFMVLAAIGYFPFTWRFVFVTDPAAFRAATGVSYAALLVVYLLVLVPSALWVPLTGRMIERPDPALWFAIRAVLLLVGAGAGGILWFAWRIAFAEGGTGAWLAAAGTVPFFIQTALLDALVWPAYFPRG